MVDATDIKAHPTASSLNKGGYTPPDWLDQGGASPAGSMGSVTVKAVPCDSTGVRGNAGTSPVLIGARKDLPPAATVMGDQG